MKNLNLIAVFFVIGIIWGCSKSSTTTVKPTTTTTTPPVTTPPASTTNSLVADSVTLYAGTLNPNATDVNGMRQVAGFSAPYGMTVDAAGNVYVADYNGNDIRKISTTGMVSTVASGMDMPVALAVDGSGNLYTTFDQLDKVLPSGSLSMVSNAVFIGLTADNTGNIYSATQTQIMKLDQSTGKMVAYAGASKSGSADGALTTASFTNIEALTADKSGNLYLLDGNNIRSINVATGQVQTLMLKSASPLMDPLGLAVDQWDNVYVVNYGGSNGVNGFVTKIASDGTVSNFAGNQKTAINAAALHGAAQSVSFNGAQGIVLLPSGNFLVSSYGNVIQEIYTHKQQ